MSTSERSGIGGPQRAGDVSADERGALSPETLDVAMLTQLANEFFRALPGQAPIPAAAQSGLSPQAAPSFETRLPQFDAPAPSVPLLPAGAVPAFGPRSGALPSEPSLAQIASRASSAESLPSPFSLP